MSREIKPKWTVFEIEDKQINVADRYETSFEPLMVLSEYTSHGTEEKAIKAIEILKQKHPDWRFTIIKEY